MRPKRVKRGHVKPPLGVSRAYGILIQRWLDGFNAWILDYLLSSWEANEVHNSGAVPKMRSDALPSHYVTEKVAGIKAALEERFNPDEALSAGIRTLGLRVDKQGNQEFRRLIGLPLKDLGIGSAAIENFRKYNVGLIKSLAGKQLEEIRDILQTAEAEALRVETLRGILEDRFDVTKSKADLLARDQVLKLNGQLTQDRQTRAGVTKYIWTTSRDERVRGKPDGLYPPEKSKGNHYQLDGTVQSWLSPPVVSEDGRREHPGGDYQCRCTAFPILEELDESSE